MNQNNKLIGLIAIFVITGMLIIGLLIFMAIKNNDSSYYDYTSDYSDTSESTDYDGIIRKYSERGDSSSDERSNEVLFIKNANFNDYPSSEGYSNIGDAFENYFEDTTWEYFQGDNGKYIVEFNGTYNHDGKIADCCIQFELYDDKTFNIDFISRDEENIEGAEESELLRDVMLKYKNINNNTNESIDNNSNE